MLVAVERKSAQLHVRSVATHGERGEVYSERRARKPQDGFPAAQAVDAMELGDPNEKTDDCSRFTTLVRSQRRQQRDYASYADRAARFHCIGECSPKL
jgi:hypothetical protein